MGWVFLIIAILVLVTLAIQYSYITLALGAIWLVIHLIVKEHKEEKRRQAAEAERKAKEANRLQRYREEQQAYRKQMIALGEQLIRFFE